MFEEAYKDRPEYVLFTGDMIQGFTSFLPDFRGQLVSFKYAAEIIGWKIPSYETMGNHELLFDSHKLPNSTSPSPDLEYDKQDICADVDNNVGGLSSETVFAQEFVNPVNGPPPENTYPVAPKYDESAYFFDRGNVRIIAYNSDYWQVRKADQYGGNLEGYVMDKQLDWISQVLDDAEHNTSIRHVFLMAHQNNFPDDYELPAVNPGGRYDFALERRTQLWEIISRHPKVVAVLNSHYHYYARILITNRTPIINAVNVSPAPDPNFKYPIWEIISGAAGAPFGYNDGTYPFDAFARVYSYCVIDVKGDRVTLTVKEINGNVITDETTGKPEADIILR
jgi:hypothetical protein